MSLLKQFLVADEVGRAEIGFIAAQRKLKHSPENRAITFRLALGIKDALEGRIKPYQLPLALTDDEKEDHILDHIYRGGSLPEPYVTWLYGYALPLIESFPIFQAMLLNDIAAYNRCGETKAAILVTNQLACHEVMAILAVEKAMFYEVFGV